MGSKNKLKRFKENETFGNVLQPDRDALTTADFSLKGKWKTDFFKNVYPILYKVLSERGGLVLLDQRNVIFWDNSVDITDEAIDAINRFYLVGE